MWPTSNKIVSSLQSADIQTNPSFHSHAPGWKRRYPCTQTALAIPKYFACRLQFCPGYRIWHASRISKRKTSEYCWFTHIKKYRDTNDTFSLFLDEFLKTYLQPIYCSLTCRYTSPTELYKVVHTRYNPVGSPLTCVFPPCRCISHRTAQSRACTLQSYTSSLACVLPPCRCPSTELCEVMHARNDPGMNSSSRSWRYFQLYVTDLCLPSM